MSHIDALFSVSSRFGTAKGIGEARVSTLVFNDGKCLQRVRNGADIGSRRIDRALQWFSDNWPPDEDWPAGIDRPAISPPPDPINV
jgi:hypothetical protein